MPEDLKELDAYARPAQSVPHFLKNLPGSHGHQTEAQLRKLISFTTTPSVMNLPEERLATIEKQIAFADKELLAIPTSKGEKKRASL